MASVKERPDQRWPVILTGLLFALPLLAIGLRGPLKAVRWRRFAKRMVLAAAGLVCVWALVLVLSPYQRAKFLVRFVAPVNDHLGIWCERHFQQSESTGEAEGLVDLLSDPNPQTRYLASRFLREFWAFAEDAEERLRAADGAAEAVRAAAEDEVPEVAVNATCLLGLFRDPEHVDFLLSRLKKDVHLDALCRAALNSLNDTSDARVLDVMLTFTEDPRPRVRRTAIGSLADYDDSRATRRLVELVLSQDEPTSRSGGSAIGSHLRWYPDSRWAPEFDRAMLAAARRQAFTSNYRGNLARNVTDSRMQAEAYLSMLKSPSVGRDSDYHTLARCRAEAAYGLSEIGLEAKVAVPALTDALDDPDTDVRRMAAEALERITGAPAPDPR